MGSWKAGPEKPRTKFCWVCSRAFRGRVHLRIKTLADGTEHDIHKSCAFVEARGSEWEAVYESTTAAKASGGGR